MSVPKGNPGCEAPRRAPSEPLPLTPPARILQAVSETYGITYGAILRRTGLTNGVAAYHICALRKQGRLWKARYEGRPHYFASRQVIETILPLTKAETVAMALPSDGAVTVEGASARVRMPPSTVRRYLTILQEQGLVSETKVGRSMQYRVKDLTALHRSLQARMAQAREG